MVAACGLRYNKYMKFFTKRLKKAMYFGVAGYLGFWADMVLRRWSPRTIVVTGSVGKTSLLKMLEYQFGAKARTSGKNNSTFGIPLDILGLEGTAGRPWRWLTILLLAPYRAFTVNHTAKYYLAEADASMPGEGKFLAGLLKPYITIWSNLGKTHSEDFEPLVKSGAYSDVDSAIAAEFAQFAMHTQRVVLTDGDNPNLAEAMTEEAPNMRRHSNEETLKQYRVHKDRTAFQMHSGNIYRFSSPLPYALGYQVALMDKLLKMLRIEPKLDMTDQDYPPGRSTYLRGISDTTIIDSSYNASLNSMETVIDMFDEIVASRKIMVLGDLLEQGSQSASEHRKLARKVMMFESNLVAVVLVGAHCKTHVEPILKKTLNVPVVSFESSKGVAKYIEGLLVGKEAILFKGSQSIYLELAIEELLANTADAAKLPRRNSFFEQKRKALLSRTGLSRA